MASSLRDLYRGLAALLRAGVVTGEAVAQLRASGTLPETIAATIEQTIAGGGPLSQAFARFPDEFPQEDVALIEAGEATGRIEENLERLAELHEQARRARQRLVGEAWYPLLLFHLAAVLTPLPSSLQVDGYLFGPTWIATALAVLVPFYVLVLLVRGLRRTHNGRAMLRRVVQRLPGFGAAARHQRRSRFVAVLLAGYDSAIPIDRALELAGRAAHEPTAATAAAAVAQGKTLFEALGPARILSSEQLARIATGEHAGEVSRVLDELATEETEAAERIYRRSMQILAKVLWGLMAIWIAIYVITTYLGMFESLL